MEETPPRGKATLDTTCCEHGWMMAGLHSLMLLHATSGFILGAVDATPAKEVGCETSRETASPEPPRAHFTLE